MTSLTVIKEWRFWRSVTRVPVMRVNTRAWTATRIMHTKTFRRPGNEKIAARFENVPPRKPVCN